LAGLIFRVLSAALGLSSLRFRSKAPNYRNTCISETFLTFHAFWLTSMNKLGVGEWLVGLRISALRGPHGWENTLRESIPLVFLKTVVKR